MFVILWEKPTVNVQGKCVEACASVLLGRCYTVLLSLLCLWYKAALSSYLWAEDVPRIVLCSNIASTAFTISSALDVGRTSFWSGRCENSVSNSFKKPAASANLSALRSGDIRGSSGRKYISWPCAIEDPAPGCQLTLTGLY